MMPPCLVGTYHPDGTLETILNLQNYQNTVLARTVYIVSKVVIVARAEILQKKLVPFGAMEFQEKML
jgi:hypothetical protein